MKSPSGRSVSAPLPRLASAAEDAPESSDSHRSHRLSGTVVSCRFSSFFNGHLRIPKFHGNSHEISIDFMNFREISMNKWYDSYEISWHVGNWYLFLIHDSLIGNICKVSINLQIEMRGSDSASHVRIPRLPLSPLSGVTSLRIQCGFDVEAGDSSIRLQHARFPTRMDG